MRKLFILAFLVLVSAAASAQDGRKYAILSLVGDKLTVVQREMTTGSNLDLNRRTEVPLPDASIDRAVVFAVEDALKRGSPSGPAPVLLASRRAALYDAGLLGASGIQQIVMTVKPMVGNTGVTHLLLVTKLRHRAMLRIADGYVGTGFLEGVGFYVDQGSMVRDIDLNEAESGFIAPYSYLMISLVELSSGRVIAQERMLGSRAATTPRERNVGYAWHRLSDQEKVTRLTEVIRDEMARAVPVVLAAR